MPINVSISTSYILEFVQALFMLNAELFRAIAINGTLVNRAAEDIYYIFGFIKYFSDGFRDVVNVVINNSTMMQYSVGIWQKVATNATYVFGDDSATWGLAYLWRKGYECIQPGAYCESYGPSVTYWGLQFFKWLFIAMSKIGQNLSVLYS
ncbi:MULTISPECIES: hypothetical protein [unclassified Archaeoglobus]|jgi:hypothetical protein|uniref:hypothetical protein n=1 Tax=unclassified Archaeoglobus TaxID=2643606 RepID=UPI0025C65603|nr:MULTISPECIES: hypothetical protein [unclassified Archaeoglobus]